MLYILNISLFIFIICSGIGCMILLLWMFGINLYIWDKYRINYYYLFDIDEKYISSSTSSQSQSSSTSFLSFPYIFETANHISIVYLANFLIYFKILRGDFPVIYLFISIRTSYYLLFY